MKKLGKVLLILIALLVVAIVVAVFYVDVLAKQGIERGATYATEVDTTLDKADVGLVSGEFTMSGLQVDNPEGFSGEHFLRLEQGALAVGLKSLFDDVVEVPLLSLQGIDVNLEQTLSGGNYSKILDSLKRFGDDETSGKPQPKREGAGTKKFIIKELQISDVKVHLNIAVLKNEPTGVNFDVPTITLRDIGTAGNNGAAISEITAMVLEAIIRAAVENGGEFIPADLIKDLNAQLADLKVLEGLKEEGLKHVEEASKQLEKIGGDLLEGLGVGSKSKE